MKISTSRGHVFGAVGLFIFLVAVFYGVVASRAPFDSPEARMYRTEADLALLKHALGVYRADFDVYPRSGIEGLEVAVGYFTNSGRYLPQGIPPDGWNRPFVYVRRVDYEAIDSMALKSSEGYLDPEGYQLYSTGADGEAGVERHDLRRDNIVSWDPTRGWRSAYTELQRSYGESRRTPDED